MSITYKMADIDDIRPAFSLVEKVWVEVGFGAFETLQSDITQNDEMFRKYTSGENIMILAADGDKPIGVVGACSGGQIRLLFVESGYHLRGIATELLHRMVCYLKINGFDAIVVNSSRYALPFYKHFGFVQTDVEQKLDGFFTTPMEYTPNEIWDVLDAKGNKTGRFHERGREMATGDYHLVVNVWKYNGRGEWLIDKRANRGMDIDGKWETTGGSAIAGDDSLTAALREAKEELGLDLDPNKGILFQHTARHENDGHTWFQDVWVFEHDCSLEDVRFQESETCEAMWATADKIRRMMASGEFLSDEFYPYFDEMIEKWG